MDPELFDVIWKALVLGFRQLIWVFRTSAKINAYFRQRKQVYQQIAEEQARADGYDIGGRRRHEAARKVSVVRRGGES